MQSKRLIDLRVIYENDFPEEFEIYPELADDERFMLLAIGMHSFCINWIGKELFKNTEFIQMVLVVYSERWVENRIYSDVDLDEDWFPESTLGTPTPYYADFIYKNISDDLKSDDFIMLELVKRKLKIEELHSKLSGNVDFLIKAVRHEAHIFTLADASLQNDVDFVRLAVRTNPAIWTLLSDEQRSDPDMQEALSDIRTYLFENIDLVGTEEVNRYCQLLPDEIRNDKELATLLLSRNYYYFKYISESLRDDLEVVRSAYECVVGWTSHEGIIKDHLSLRIKAIVENSSLTPVEVLTKAIENEALHGKLGATLKVKDEPKLTPAQRKRKSGAL